MRYVKAVVQMLFYRSSNIIIRLESTVVIVPSRVVFITLNVGDDVYFP